METSGGQDFTPPSQGMQVGKKNKQYNTWILESSPVRWPIQIGRPPAEPAAFQPRPQTATAIVEHLNRTDSTVSTHAVVTGGGGVGKTQMAAAKFRAARDTEPHCSCG